MVSQVSVLVVGGNLNEWRVILYGKTGTSFSRIMLQAHVRKLLTFDRIIT